MNIISLDGTDGQSDKWRDDATLEVLYAELPNDKSIPKSPASRPSQPQADPLLMALAR